jgi:hypothetical protein
LGLKQISRNFEEYRFQYRKYVPKSGDFRIHWHSIGKKRKLIRRESRHYTWVGGSPLLEEVVNLRNHGEILTDSRISGFDLQPHSAAFKQFRQNQLLEGLRRRLDATGELLEEDGDGVLVIAEGDQGRNGEQEQ